MVLCTIAALLLGAAQSGIPVLSEQSRLTEPQPVKYDHFGNSVSCDADTAAIGVPGDDDLGWESGSVHVLLRDPQGWSLQAELHASDASPDDGFGESVALDGETLVVGAPAADPAGTVTGTAYAFVRSGSSWSEQTRLMDPAGGWGDQFGKRVALSGDTALIAARGDDQMGASAGAAYVFVRSGTIWSLQQKLVAADGAPDDDFGWSVALDGDRAIVGARNHADDSGAAYVFKRSGAVWSQEGKLFVGGYKEHLGSSVDIQGDRAASGAYRDSSRGAVWVYSWSGSSWVPDARLEAHDVAYLDAFGWSVSLDGDVLVAGSRGDDVVGPSTGSAYLFRNRGGSWAEEAKFLTSSGPAQGLLGEIACVQGDRVLLGAPGEDIGGSFAGAVYEYSISTRIGSAYCFGDGTGTPCPCGNESSAGWGLGCLSSEDHGGLLFAGGSASLASDDLVLMGYQLVKFKNAMLVAGTQASGSGLGVPFGDGLLCVGGGLKRLGIQSCEYWGSAIWGPGLAAQAGWSAGDTRYFQVWHRDSPLQGPCGTGFNLTNAYELSFTP